MLDGDAVFADELDEEIDAAGDELAMRTRRLMIVAAGEERQDRERRGRGPELA